MWTIVLALALAIPIILLPVLYVSYLTIGGLAATRKEKVKTKITRISKHTVTG